MARKPGHRGEHEISRKPSRRESRSASAEPVCSCAFSYVHFAHETAGAARTRPSLRPLRFPRAIRLQHLGRFAPRDRGGAFPENQVLDPIPMPGRILTRLAVSPSPLRRKVLEFRSVLKDRMTPRELIAFVGASASVRRNEKRAQLCHRHKGGHHARQSPGRKNV